MLLLLLLLLLRYPNGKFKLGIGKVILAEILKNLLFQRVILSVFDSCVVKVSVVVNCSGLVLVDSIVVSWLELGKIVDFEVLICPFGSVVIISTTVGVSLGIFVGNEKVDDRIERGSVLLGDLE